MASPVALTDLLDHVLDAMRLNATEHPTVLHRTLDLIEEVGRATREPTEIARLDVHVHQLVAAFSRSSPQDCDADALGRHADRVRHSLRAVAGGP